MVKLIILLIGFIGDILVDSLLIGSTIARSFSITPNLLFISLIIVTYKEHKFNSILIAIFTGLLMDSMNRDVIFLYTIVYLATVLIVQAWTSVINYSIIEIFLTVLAAVFVKEFMMFIFYTNLAGVTMSLNTYLLNHFVATILFDIPLILIYSFVKKRAIEEDIYKQRQNRRRASMDNRY